MTEAAKALVHANKAVLNQGLDLVEKLSDAQFTFVSTPWSMSSIGQHFRHVLDMYEALRQYAPGKIVNYDKRRRGSAYERSCQETAGALRGYLVWLDAVESETLGDIAVTVCSEVNPDESVSPLVSSSFLRELMFVGSHAVHHYALIKMLARMQDIEVDAGFGIAPATLSDMRKKQVCAP